MNIKNKEQMVILLNLESMKRGHYGWSEVLSDFPLSQDEINEIIFNALKQIQNDTDRK